MKVYRVRKWNWIIEEVEAEKETGNFYIIGKYRESKKSEWSEIFKTYAEAYEKLRQRVEYRKQMYEEGLREFEAVRKP